MTPQEKRREGHLRRTYGITLIQYNELLERQGHRCGVCNRTDEELGQTLSVDHNHATGAIRGLLCTYCNRYVVGRHKEGTLLSAAGRYLSSEYTGWFVPPKKKKRRKKTPTKRTKP